MGGVVLALSLCLTLPTACGDGGPTGSDRPGDHRGITRGEGPREQLLGTWRAVVVVTLPGDLQTWTTTWRFDPAGSCRQTVETESLAEGFPRVTERSCSFVARDFDVAIAFTGGGRLVLRYSFADFSSDRLVLDGFEYQRLA